MSNSRAKFYTLKPSDLRRCENESLGPSGLGCFRARKTCSFMQASGTQLAHNSQTRLLFDEYVMRRRIFSWIYDYSACDAKLRHFEVVVRSRVDWAVCVDRLLSNGHASVGTVMPRGYSDDYNLCMYTYIPLWKFVLLLLQQSSRKDSFVD
jgi:hypothetical protein